MGLLKKQPHFLLLQDEVVFLGAKIVSSWPQTQGESLAKLKQNKVLSTNTLLEKQLRTLERHIFLKINWILKAKYFSVVQIRLGIVLGIYREKMF